MISKRGNLRIKSISSLHIKWLYNTPNLQLLTRCLNIYILESDLHKIVESIQFWILFGLAIFLKLNSNISRDLFNKSS